MPNIAGGKFVITGGASQIGIHVAERLLIGQAREVVLLDNLSLGSSDLVQPLLADRRCRLVRGDVLMLHDLYDPLEGADGVFAIAAWMASSIEENPWVGLDVNVRGLQNTLEACRCRGVGKVVFSSSVGVYGAPGRDSLDEASPLHWHDLSPAMALYCATKVAGEGLVRLYSQRYGIDFVALRYSAVYGEQQHGRALVGGYIAQTWQRIRRGDPPIIEGDGEQVHDYVYAGDVARANLLAMESPVSGESINICSGQAIARRRVVELVMKSCGTELSPEYRPRSGSPSLPAARVQVFSREKAREVLAWEPQVGIEEGIDRVVKWMDERRR
jgi:UDP-glucose 4-epimerase